MIISQRDQKWSSFIFISISLCLLGYSISRAWLLSFTIDEAYSYMNYVKDTYWNIFTYKFNTSNNHVLNSLLMKLSTELFTPTEFILRLQSTLGHIIFLLCSWAVLKDIRNPWFRLGGFILLNTNPFVLDFFSLARGYGLAGGLMMASLYFLMKYIQSHKNTGLWLALCTISAGLSAMANFSWLNYMLSVSCIALLWAVYVQYQFKNRSFFLKSLIALFLSGAPFFFYLIKIATKLKMANELYYGGRKGFWTDTLGSLIDSTFYHANYPQFITILFQVIIILISTGGLTFFLHRLMIKKEPAEKYGFFIAVSAILVITVLSTIIQHLLFNNPYLLDRSAILFIDLFALFASYLFYYTYSSFKFTIILYVILLCGYMFNFILAINFTHTKIWIQQSDIKNMMRDLDGIRLKKDPAKKDWYVSARWDCCPAADFYRDIYHYTWLNPIEVRPPTLKEDYFFYPENDHDTIARAKYKIIKEYPATGFALYENLDPSPGILIASKTLKMAPSDNECKGVKLVTNPIKMGLYSAYLKPDVYSPYLIFPVGTLKGDSCFRAEGSVWIYFDDFNKKCGEVVISIEDNNRKVYQWSSLKLDRYFDNKEGHWMHVKFGDWTSKIRTDKDILHVFVHNNGKYPFYVDGLEAKLVK